MSAFKILDGAMGSELIRRGMELPEHIWSAAANLINPELVLEIHREYVDAGADYITANTLDRKSTRLNSSHKPISYADCCLKKKTPPTPPPPPLHVTTLIIRYDVIFDP